MNTIDLVTVATFGIAIVSGVMWLIVQDMRRKLSAARIHARMETAFDLAQRAKKADGKARRQHADLFKVERYESAWARWTAPKLARLRTVAGKRGLKIVVGVAFAAEMVAVVMLAFMPLPGFVATILPVALPVFAAMKTYSWLVNRFRQRFLDGFPDVIDLLVRAVRAGVPVTHVISTAADEVEEPLRQEFRLMGDALQVGLDLDEVLTTAARRIAVADFSFFCVCLKLQRETGGQLGETLENLAGIVRSRREIRQKTRALTGEARITTRILTVIPPLILLSMFLINRSYVMVLFETPTGTNILTYAVVSVVVGVALITKMSKLNTMR
ncbi:type II secretion system F family protein [Paraburkholderia sp. A1RI_3L]|uniref:type II secretion system F family protein n=1 Tax=Paraburkholderia TaxID=1822464 RepID=UPI003B8233D3